MFQASWLELDVSHTVERLFKDAQKESQLKLAEISVLDPVPDQDDETQDAYPTENVKVVLIDESDVKAFPERYSIQTMLGSGTYGKVFLAKKKDEPGKGELCAIKVFKSEEDATIEATRIAHLPTSPFILKGNPFGTRFIVMDYYETDLEHYIRSSPENTVFSERQILEWLLQLTSAISAMHKANLIHRDIKSSNVLLTSQLNVKLIDFGTLKAMEPIPDSKTHTFVGTPVCCSFLRIFTINSCI